MGSCCQHKEEAKALDSTSDVNIDLDSVEEQEKAEIYSNTTRDQSEELSKKQSYNLSQEPTKPPAGPYRSAIPMNPKRPSKDFTPHRFSHDDIDLRQTTLAYSKPKQKIGGLSIITEANRTMQQSSGVINSILNSNVQLKSSKMRSILEEGSERRSLIRFSYSSKNSGKS